MDLFDIQGTDDSGAPKFDPRAPLAVRMRPVTLDDVVGQDHLLGEGSPLRRLLEPAARGTGVSSVILWGPPGTGKTTLAYLVARASDRHFDELSAVSSGVKDIREVVAGAKRRLAATGEETVLFVDEVHRFSKSQQDALLPAVENRWVTLIAATTENPSFSVISPLLSRSLLLVLHGLDEDAIGGLIDRAVADERGLKGAVELDRDARAQLVRLAGSDARKALTLLEAAAGAAASRAPRTGSLGVGNSGEGAEVEQPGGDRTEVDPADGEQTEHDRAQDRSASADRTGPRRIALDDVEAAANQALVRWDQDQHYDVASAFIKSMRGSDAQAAVHYLARMIEAGEDPRFIARRVMICAAEDVGLADPTILPLTVAAAQAVALIGMPEARIILSEAVLAVATAPKSNAAYLAIDRALGDLRDGKGGPVPAHLRDAHYAGAKGLGHGEGYVYAHDAPHSVAAQRYLPDDLEGTRYYEPTGNGHEAMITKRLAAIEDLLHMR